MCFPLCTNIINTVIFYTFDFQPVCSCCASNQCNYCFHCDREVRYCTQTFRDVLRETGKNIIQSMSRKGNGWDNACAESFFKALKWELDTLEGKHSQV